MVTSAEKMVQNVSKAEQDLGWIPRALGWGDPYIVNSNERWQNHGFNCAWNRSVFCTFLRSRGSPFCTTSRWHTQHTTAILIWWSEDKIAFLSWLSSNATSQAPSTAGWTEKYTNRQWKSSALMRESIHPSVQTYKHTHIYVWAHTHIYRHCSDKAAGFSEMGFVQQCWVVHFLYKSTLRFLFISHYHENAVRRLLGVQIIWIKFKPFPFYNK